MAPHTAAIRGRARSRLATAAQVDAAKRSLCVELFKDPHLVTHALSHVISDPWTIEPHTHTSLLQFDVIDDCEGEAVAGDRRVPLSGTTLLVNCPGRRHGYTLRPSSEGGNVYHIKLKPPRSWMKLSYEPLPKALTGLPRQTTLVELGEAFARTWSVQGLTSKTAGIFSHLIGLWPVHANITADLGTGNRESHHMSASVSIRVCNAIERLAQRYANPPDLEELAQAAHLSPRHFARVFRHEFGCSPHTYVTTQRLQVARRLLLESPDSVSSVAESMGFSSLAAFSRWFTRLDGRTPRHFREAPHTF